MKKSKELNISGIMRDKFIKDMGKLQSIITRRSKFLNSMDRLGVNFFNTDLVESMYECEEMLIYHMATLHNIEVDSLLWFIYENDFGNKKLCAKEEGQDIVDIDSVETFYDYEKKR